MLQYFKISKSTTLSQLSNAVGSTNVDSILNANGLTRTPLIGKLFANKCSEAISNTKAVSTAKKISLLNTVTSDAEVFETVASLSENEWKVFATNGNFKNALSVPSTITLPNSSSIIGGTDIGVSTTVYKKVMNRLSSNRTLDSSVFSEYSTAKYSQIETGSSSSRTSTDMYNAFAFPWGKIQLYSSLADETVDFPVYPEEIAQSRVANYETMPDTIYQYEPWYVYTSSGPRSQEYTFHFHRDMWSGNHLDGKANDLIRFCEANLFPRYNGSAVLTSTVKMIINGTIHCQGILTNMETKWSGPIGQDGWYLDCELTLTIVEVAPSALNFDKMRKYNIVGGS